MTPEEQLAALNESFGLPGVLAFELHPGTAMIRAQVTLPSATATLYLHGAHLTEWQPAGEQPMLFLSEQSEYAPTKAIRGGIPICFPWFGPRSPEIQPAPPSDGPASPSHGFARISEWQIAFAALEPGEEALHLTLMLEPNELSRSLGFDGFRAVCEFRIGRTLEVRLSIANPGTQPLHFEEALHSYFHVGDVRHTAITGLETARYLDKTDGGRQKSAPDGPLRLSGTTDRVFPANTAEVCVVDEALGRTIVVSKTNSATTVVWNPWAELAQKLADLPDDAWPQFVCVEAANTGHDAVTLAPSAVHTMQLTVHAEPHGDRG